MGRKYYEDTRDNNYLISNHYHFINEIKQKPPIAPVPTRSAIKPTPTPSKSKSPLPVRVSLTPTKTPTTTPTLTPSQFSTVRYWQDDIWWGNQLNTPMCVGYAWAHWISDGPIVHDGVQPVVSPSLIYTEAQKIDEWPGENYAGTSVRAGVKYLQSIGKVVSYYWAFDVDTLVSTVLNLGPVVVGTNWYYNMFFPLNGVISVGGSLVGGHAYVINGVDTNTKRFRIKNSWGQSWGVGGHAFISFSDMSRLISERGEVCLAIENIF